MKILKWTVLAVVVLLIAGAVVLYVNLNGIVKHTVETQSSDSLNLRTTLGGANLALFGGSLSLNNLEIASPSGYSAPHLLTLGRADVGVSYGQLRSDPVHVKTVTLKSPKLVIEQVGGKMNFQSAMDTMPKPPSDPNAKPLKVIIDDLTIQDAQVMVRPGLPGLPEEIPLLLPTVNLKNVGSGEGAQNGAAMKDVVMQVVTVMAASASKSNALPEQLKSLLNVNVAQVTDRLGAEAQKQISKALPPELANTVGQTLGGLIGQKSGDTQPTSKPAIDPAKAVQEGVNGLLKKKKGS